jgi:putative membrane protein
MKRLTIILALLGLLIALFLVGYFGVDNVASAVSRIGWKDFVVIVLWQLGLFVVLGFAWDVIAPPTALRRPWVLVWARMVRDAATNCLPFSQVGGMVFGTRVATLHGMPWHTATASTVVDATAEFLAQIAFTGIGLAILLARAPSSSLAVPLEIGLGLAVMGCFGFIWLQKGAETVFARIGRRIAGQWFDNAQERVAVLQAELALIYGHKQRLAIGFLLHLAGWVGTGAAGWIAYRALGNPVDFDDVLAIEALLSAVAVVAFLVPVNAGVQEAGYVGLGAIFGVAPEVSIAVSLIRRARDILIGVPILLLWQYVEVRRLKPAPVARVTSEGADAGRGGD